MMIATLIPFGCALLAENINTPNMSWAVFCFGLILFVESPVQLLFFLAVIRRDDVPVTEDSPFSGETYARMGAFLAALTTIFGTVAVAASLFWPWLALALYGLLILSKVNPVSSFNRMIPRLNKLLNLGL
jgi:hypothetical protein